MMDILKLIGVNARGRVKLCTSFYNCTLPSVIDQREIQAIGGLCREYSASCLMKILAEVLEIEDTSVLDLTYGVGEFYRFWHPTYLVAFDVVDWRKIGYTFVCTPDELYETSFVNAPKLLGDRRFDVVIFDPPYNVHAVSRNRKRKPWLYHGKENLPLLIRHFPKIARRYATKYIIAKFMDSEDVTVFDLVREFGQTPTHVIVFRKFTTYVPREHIKIVKLHSYFLIWKVSP